MEDVLKKKLVIWGPFSIVKNGDLTHNFEEFWI